MTKEQYIESLAEQPSAWKGHGMFAINLVEVFKPKVVVDLGVDYGFSTFSFAYPQIGTIYGIDWFQGDENTGFRDTFTLVEEKRKELSLSNVNLIKGDFTEVSKTWDKVIDILHIDGFHSYEAVKNDYENWIKYCHEESIVLFHDTVSFPNSVGKFFNELEGFKIVKEDSAGLGILTKSKSILNSIKL